MTNLVLINKSLGELDWIISKWEELKLESTDTWLIVYRIDMEKLRAHAPSFIEIFGENIYTWDEISRSKGIANIDNLLDRISTKVSNVFGRRYQRIFDVFSDRLKEFFAIALITNADIPKECIVFHEFNARTTFPLLFLRQHAQTINFYPHHFNSTPQLQNENKLYYERLFSPVQVQHLYNNFEVVYENFLRRTHKKKCLILTRQCSLAYGFDYHAAYHTLNLYCDFLHRNNVKIYFKHHPREHNMEYWEKIESRFRCKRVTVSVFDFIREHEELFCLHLYTSTVNEIVKFGVPCFDISPYNEPIPDDVRANLSIQENINSTRRVDFADFKQIFQTC